MKRIEMNWRGARKQAGGVRTQEAIRGAIARMKQQLLMDYALRAGEHLRLLRLALNEAEALAWASEYPHLFFPELAVETAERTVAWHERQRALRRGQSELSFAE